MPFLNFQSYEDSTRYATYYKKFDTKKVISSLEYWKRSYGVKDNVLNIIFLFLLTSIKFNSNFLQAKWDITKHLLPFFYYLIFNFSKM